MSQFKLRELLLLVLCIALIFALIEAKRPQPVIDSLHADATPTPQVDVTTHFVLAKNIRNPLVLQFQDGDSDWITAHEFRPREFHGIYIHTIFNSNANNPTNMALEINCLGKTLIHSPNNLRSYRGTFTGLNWERVNSQQPFYELAWKESTGTDRICRFRVVYE